MSDTWAPQPPPVELDSASSVIRSEETVDLGRKLSRAVDGLEDEIEELIEKHDGGFPPNLKRRFEAIRNLVKDVDVEKPIPHSPMVRIIDGLLVWKCEIKRLTMDDWPKPDWMELRFPKSVMKAFYHSTSGYGDGDDQDEGNILRSKEMVQRVVIASEPLRSELEEITDIKFQFWPAILAPPYKLLAQYYPQIDARLPQLEENLAKMDEEANKTGTPKDTRADDDTATSSLDGEGQDTRLTVGPARRRPASPGQRMKTFQNPGVFSEEDLAVKRRRELIDRIDHLRLLRDFIKTDLAHYLELRAKIKDGTLKRISFEDLWHLFQPGEVVYCKDRGHDQCYQVYSVTGGQPRRRKTTKKEDDEMFQRRRQGPPLVHRRRRYNYSSYSDSGEESNDNFDKDCPVNAASGIGSWSALTIDCYAMGFDGQFVGPLDAWKRIRPFSGEVEITELATYPIRFHKQRDEITAKLEARGRRFLASYGHKSYSGSTVPLGGRLYREKLRGDIFIDFKTYYSAHPAKKPRLGVLRKTRNDFTQSDEYMMSDNTMRGLMDHEVNDKLTEMFMSSHQPLMEEVSIDLVRDNIEYLRLLPYRVPAYVFKTRRFVHVDIEHVSEIDKSPEARDNSFEDLVIPEGHRNLLIALVQNHATGDTMEVDPDILEGISTQIDIVRGKGRGLIILLHGPPGSGKTSTAETIAAYTRRPLYSITCGDLGINPNDVEDALQGHSDRAHRWGCVLLLDEADVFLTRRDWKDTKRNALVSVFLRQLEYYSGILFLTTNRVGVIDEAFKSRIHVSLCYPRIELKETLQIWDNLLNRLNRDNKTTNIQIKFDRDALLSFAEKHYKTHEPHGTTWNGRQIRNAFQTALALGRFERERQLKVAGLTSEEAQKSGQKKLMIVKLTSTNFKSIAKTAREFEDYLTSVRGPDSEMAKMDQLRDDMHNVGLGMVRKDYGKARSPKNSVGYLSPSPGANFLRTSGRRSPGSNRAARRPKDEDDDEDGEDEDDIFEEELSDE